MPNDKMRRQIVFEAARLMYSRQEGEYYRAKLKAAKRICHGWVKPSDLPSNAEIRDELQRMAGLYEGTQRTENLLDMRIDALRMMKLLHKFRPRLIGSTWTGHVRAGSDIDLHVFSNSPAAVTGTLDYEGIVYDVERKVVRKHGEERIYTHVHVEDRFPIELTVYAMDKVNYTFISSITGKPIEGGRLDDLLSLLKHEYPDQNVDDLIADAEHQVDPFLVYRSLLLPLDSVMQNRDFHPEGDVLYHSLQVFELAREAQPWDEEFLLAALLHDVGKGIDPYDHVQAGLDALEGTISERTTWLIEHHMDAHKLHDNSIGFRARRRLSQHDDFETLELLGECDRAGRVPGAQVDDLDDVLEHIRELSRQ